MTVHGIEVKIDSALTALPAGRTENNYDSKENLVQIFADPSEAVTLEVEASAVEGADLQFTWEGRAMDFKGDGNSGWQYFDTSGPKLTVTPGADTRYECIVKDRFGYYKTVRFDVIVSGKKDLSRTIIKLSETKLPYTGKPVEPEVSVLYKGQKLEKGKDYTVSYFDNVNAGTATVTISGAGEYTGSVTASFVIDPKPISSLEVSGITAKTFNGKAQTQAIVVNDGIVTLVEGIDYDVAYENNVHAGTASVVITGKGNYTGTVTKTFTIKKASNTITAKNFTKTYSTNRQGDDHDHITRKGELQQADQEDNYYSQSD